MASESVAGTLDFETAVQESSGLEQELESLTIESEANSRATRASKPKGRKLISDIHKHTRPPRENEPKRHVNGERFYYCLYCTDKATKFSNTSGLRSHLKSKHDVVSYTSGEVRSQKEKESVEKLYDQLCELNTHAELDRIVLSRVLDRTLVEKKLLSLIINRRLPLSIVEWPEFREYSIALNREASSFIPASHNTIKSRINHSFPEAKDHVRRVLQSAKTSIHLAIDIWTSPNRHLLLAICGSFLDANDRFWNLLLGIPEVYGHSGEVQWKALRPVLQEYGIDTRIGIVVGDNSSTNDTLCREIATFLRQEYGDTDWNALHQRIRCLGHIFNLVVQAFLFTSEEDEEVLSSYERREIDQGLNEQEIKERDTYIRRKMGVLGKLHNIAKHIRASPQRVREFVEDAGRLIPLDNITRWNSWFKMLKAALDAEIRSAIQEYTEKYRATGLLDKRDVLSTDDWASLGLATQFLEMFEGATLELEGSQPTLCKVLEDIDYLTDYCSARLEDQMYKVFKPRIQRSLDKLNNYKAKLEVSPYYAAARILHPERRTTWLLDENENEKIPNARETIWQVDKLWDRFKRNRRTQLLQTDTLDLLKGKQQAKELSAFQKLREAKRHELIRPGSLDEFEMYKKDSVSYISEGKPLEWWLKSSQQTRFPLLSRFAIEVLTIPAMSDKPERVFSGARRTISWDRASLGVKTVEQIECLKEWKTSGILDLEL